MAKVTVSIGLNLPLSNSNKFDRITPSAMVEVDTDLDIGKQISEALETGEKIWGAISDFLEAKVMKETGTKIDIGK